MTRVAVVVGIVLISLYGAGRLWVVWSIPTMHGTEPVPGLADSVVVLWDSLAVPHLIAKNDSDFFTALGYLHARDRMWQMDLLRHVAQGRLSEIFGRRLLTEDIAWRELELRRLAAARLPGLSGESQRVLRAYARGVNAWIAADNRAFEFRVLRHAPEPWEPVHGLEIGLLQAWDLRTDGNELELAELTARWGGDTSRVRQLLPRHSDAPAIIEAGKTFDPGNHQSARTSRARIPGVPRFHRSDAGAYASNSWVISGRRTASGKPLLANDPHLTLHAPSTWYLVGAHAPTYHVVGATIPGLPVVILGHTAAVAWGFTNAMVDDVDYVFVELSPDRSHFRGGDGWAPVEVVAETIVVRSDSSVQHVRRRTAYGPVVTSHGTRRPVVLRWTGQDGGSDELAALLGMARAATAAEFAAALGGFRAPEQNVLFADTAGTIAYRLAGRVPRRRRGDSWLPSDGRTGAPWTGYIHAAEDLPSLSNPAAGRIVTANNETARQKPGLFISRHYDMGYRAQRILELLEADTAPSAQSASRHQLDIVDLFARSTRSLPARAALAAGRADLADRLRSWDGAMSADRVEPTLFWSWYRELQRLTYDDESPGYHPAAPLHRWIRNRESGWFDDVRTAETETLDTLARRALTAVLGARRLSPWGETHQTVMEHPLAAVPFLGGLLRLRIGPLKTAGSNYTVNNASSTEQERPFTSSYGPSLRHVVDLAMPDGAGGFILPAGQSGHPLSPHYDDQTARWIRGELWILPLDAGRVRAVDTLLLVAP
jgi:penicillin amidase